MNPAALAAVLEAGARSLAAALAVWAVLRLFRVRNVPAQKAAWSLVLAAAFAMPFAMRWHWLPAADSLRLPALPLPARLFPGTAHIASSPLRSKSAGVFSASLKTAPLEHFRFTCRHCDIVQGGFYFHPSDEDLSLGTPERKKPLGIQVSVNSRIENAVTPRNQTPVLKGHNFSRAVKAGKINGALAPGEWFPSDFDFYRRRLSSAATDRPDGAAPAPRPAAPANHPRSIRPLTLAWLLYLAVVAVLLLRLMAGLAAALRLWFSAEPVAADLAEIIPGAGVRWSSRVSSPVNILSGIVLPADYPEWNAEKLRIVLAHERSHVRQGDFYLQLLAGLYAALYWFSPLGWWLKRKLSELGEALGDRAGVREAASHSSYAELLLEFASLPRPTLTGVAMARTGSLTLRIERLLNESVFRQAFAAGRRRALLAVLVVPAALFASVALVRVQAAGQTPAQTSPIQQTEQNPSQAQPATGVSTPPDQPITNQVSPVPPPASTPEPGAAPMPASPQAPAVAQHPAPPQSSAAAPAPPDVVVMPSMPSGSGPVSMPPVQVQIPPIPPMPNLNAEINAELNAKLDAMRDGFYFDFPYADGDDGQSWALVNGSGGSPARTSFYGHFNGGSREDFEKAREMAHGPFFWFERDGKSYIVEDPSIVNEIEAMQKPMEDLRSQMRTLRGQQRDLSRQLRDEMRQHHPAAISKPDLSRQMAELNAAVDSLKASKGDTVTQQQLMEVQRRIAAIQGQLARAESGLYSTQWTAAMSNWGQQESKLGAEEGRLGAEMGRMASANSNKINNIIIQSLRDGKAKPVQKEGRQ